MKIGTVIHFVGEVSLYVATPANNRRPIMWLVTNKITLNAAKETLKVKVKKTRYRPGAAQRVPGS